jgi:hypothetical protein
MEHILSHDSSVIVGCADQVNQRCAPLGNEFDICTLYHIDLRHDHVWFIGMALADDFLPDVCSMT